MALRRLLSSTANAADQRRLYLPVAIAVLTAISTGSFWVALREDVPQRLQVDPPFYDFGHVQQGEVLKLDLVLTNNTKHRIELGEAFGSCHCASVGKLTGRVLEPRDAIYVPVKWDIRGRRNRTLAEIVFEYRLLSDANSIRAISTGVDTVMRGVAFRTSAHVEPEYKIIPEKIVFHSSRSDEVQLLCRRNESSKLKLIPRLVDYGSNSAAIKIRAANPNDNNVSEIIVSFDSTLWNRDVKDDAGELQVQLVTNSEYEPYFVVPVEVKQDDKN